MAMVVARRSLLSDKKLQCCGVGWQIMLDDMFSRFRVCDRRIDGHTDRQRACVV